jgi:hypothetical protein
MQAVLPGREQGPELSRLSRIEVQEVCARYAGGSLLAPEVIMRFRTRTLLLSFLLPVTAATIAGTAEVSFVNGASYTDAGTTKWDEDANLQALARHLQGLGQRLLAANQVLKVEVLDVDLAGTVRPARHGAAELRVLRGAADYPRIHLKYTLEADGVVQGSGTEWLTDLNYARGLAGRRDSESLYYEKRMLDRWFNARFVEGRAGAG